MIDMPMRERITNVDELRTWKDKIPFHYEYSAGVAGEKFLRGLKQGKILAAKCPECGKRYLPPKMYCVDCFEEIGDFEEVGPAGKVAGITEAYVDFEGKAVSEPRQFAFITFKGVTGGLIHRLVGEGLRVGSNVIPRFAESSKRVGALTDIEAFFGVRATG